VTAKIRLGWNEASRNYHQVARLLEDNGAAAIAVHGRTRAQGLRGLADWDAIAEIRQAVSIPVIANGDVMNVSDIERIKAHTGCPAVMIGRGAIGNPWIFSRLDREQVPLEEVRRVIRTHLERMIEFYGPRYGLIWFRKHIIRYIRSYKFSASIRQQLISTERLVRASFRTPEELGARLRVALAWSGQRCSRNHPSGSRPEFERCSPSGLSVTLLTRRRETHL
jgi:tRNA-dihydrouridine synthase B